MFSRSILTHLTPNYNDLHCHHTRLNAHVTVNHQWQQPLQDGTDTTWTVNGNHRPPPPASHHNGKWPQSEHDEARASTSEHQ